MRSGPMKKSSGAVADASDTDCGMDFVYSCHLSSVQRWAGFRDSCSGQTTAKPRARLETSDARSFYWLCLDELVLCREVCWE